VKEKNGHANGHVNDGKRDRSVFSANGAAFNFEPGASAPGSEKQEKISAEGAIH
jgi:hypothetical protein